MTKSKKKQMKLIINIYYLTQYIKNIIEAKCINVK